MAERNTQSLGLALRMIAGFTMAPAAATLIAVATYDGFWHAGLFPQGAPLHSLDSAASLGAGVAILAVLMTVAAGPSVVWLKAHGPLSLRRLLGLGAVLGNVPFAVIIVGIVATNAISGTLSPDISKYWYGLRGALVRVALGVICGMGSAAVFWLVAVCGTTNERSGAGDGVSRQARGTAG